MLRFLLIIGLIIPNLVFADSTAGQILDAICQDVQNHGATWQSTMMSAGVTIFGMFWTAETSWKLAKGYLEGNYGKLWSLLLLRIITGAFFFYWVKHPDIWQGIIQYFTDLGAKAGSFNMGTNSGSWTVKPSALLNNIDIINNKVLDYVDNARWTDIPRELMILIDCLIIDVAILAMTIMLTITLLQSYIVLSGGIALTGFAGSSWTMSYFQSYLRYAIGIGITFMVLCLLLGMFNDHINQMVTNISTAQDAKAIMTAFFEALIKSLLFAALVILTPSMASSMLSGTINAGIQAAIAVGGAAVMGGSGMLKSMGGAANTGKGIMDSITNLATGKSSGELIKSAAQGTKDFAQSMGEVAAQNKISTGSAMGNKSFTDFMKDSAAEAVKKGANRSGSGNGMSGGESKSNKEKALDSLKSTVSSAKDSSSHATKGVGGTFKNLSQGATQGVDTGRGPNFGNHN